MLIEVSETLKHELLCSDLRYPEGLFFVDQPPRRIYVSGSAEVLSSPGLAIVGARKATPYGLNCARRFARMAALRGITVVSGGAIGCDQAAHRGALEVGGKTIVVLGCGADVVYPSRAKELFEQILWERGALVSEAPWGSPPSRWGFKRRNRIIAGIAQATLIVEAGLPSGTFSTADATLSQGKEVLAVPGSIFAKESKGANRLIAQGAIPIVDDESFSDALFQLFGVPDGIAGSIMSTRQSSLFGNVNGTDSASGASGASEASGASAASGASRASVTSGVTPRGLESRVLEALAQQPLRAEALRGICGDDVIEVIRYLSSLELAGLVLRMRDGRYAAVQN